MTARLVIQRASRAPAPRRGAWRARHRRAGPNADRARRGCRAPTAQLGIELDGLGEQAAGPPRFARGPWRRWRGRSRCRRGRAVSARARANGSSASVLVPCLCSVTRVRARLRHSRASGSTARAEALLGVAEAALVAEQVAEVVVGRRKCRIARDGGAIGALGLAQGGSRLRSTTPRLAWKSAALRLELDRPCGRPRWQASRSPAGRGRCSETSQASASSGAGVAARCASADAVTAIAGVERPPPAGRASSPSPAAACRDALGAA